MEFLLFIIAGIVVYYLYYTLQDYLKNPLEKQRKKEYDAREDPYFTQTQEIPQETSMQRFLKTEIGIVLAICSQLPSKKENLKGYEIVMQKFFDEYSQRMQLGKEDKHLAQSLIYDEQSFEIVFFAKKFLEISYAEYQKRLKFVEFLLLLVYIDGKLDEKEKEFLLDVAANLEIDNTDFNIIYDRYEQEFAKTEQQEEDFNTQEEKEKVLNEKILEFKIDFFDMKTKDLLPIAVNIAKINRANITG